METGSYRTASTTTQSLTTIDFPRVFGMVRFIGLYRSLWRDQRVSGEANYGTSAKIERKSLAIKFCFLGNSRDCAETN